MVPNVNDTVKCNDLVLNVTVDEGHHNDDRIKRWMIYLLIGVPLSRILKHHIHHSLSYYRTAAIFVINLNEHIHVS